MTVTYVTIGRASRLRDAGDYVNFAVPDDHLVRRIDAALDLSWLRIDLSPHYSSTVASKLAPLRVAMSDLST
jgi:hypothetical protein